MRKEKALLFIDMVYPLLGMILKTLPKQVVFSLPVKTSEKDLATAQREFSMAESCGMSLTDILPDIFFEISPLFSGDLPTHAENHTLVSEIEVAVPEKPIFNFHDNQPTSIVVDFMSIF